MPLWLDDRMWTQGIAFGVAHAPAHAVNARWRRPLSSGHSTLVGWSAWSSQDGEGRAPRRAAEQKRRDQQPLGVTHRRSVAVMARLVPGLVPAGHGLRVDPAEGVDVRGMPGRAGLTGPCAQESVSTALVIIGHGPARAAGKHNFLLRKCNKWFRRYRGSAPRSSEALVLSPC